MLNSLLPIHRKMSSTQKPIPGNKPVLPLVLTCELSPEPKWEIGIFDACDTLAKII